MFTFMAQGQVYIYGVRLCLSTDIKSGKANIRNTLRLQMDGNYIFIEVKKKVVGLIISCCLILIPAAVFD